jgi:hypothetical protein
LPEVTIAKESKLKACCSGGLDETKLSAVRAIPAIFGNFGSSGNEEDMKD